MSLLLRLFYEFFKVGLFSIGGGMATLPFLKTMGETTGWFSYTDLMDMLAVSESTPGPLGVNMATYIGFRLQGIAGAVTATLGEITPSIIVILIVAAMLEKFRSSKTVSHALYGMRAASTGLIGAAFLSVFAEVILKVQGVRGLNLKAVILAAVLYLLTDCLPATKKLHPVFFIAIAAAAGVLFDFT